MAVVNTPQNPNRLNNKVYAMPVPNGAPISYFINSAQPFDTPNFADLIISVFDCEGNIVLDDVVQLQDVVTSGGYRIYWENMVITSLTVGRTYELKIYDSVTDEIFLDLGYIKFVNPSPRYTELSYRNSTDTFNYAYEALPSFRNVVFVELARIDDQGEYDLTQYSEASTGNIRNQKSQVKFYDVFESHLFDDDRHDAMKVLSGHDDILVNTRVYTVKEGYQKETDIRSGISKGVIELYDVARNEINLKG